jgi:hypothetical protein
VVSCGPASGSTFPLGTTTVTCTATDAHNNSSSGSFDVVVGDTTESQPDAAGHDRRRGGRAVGRGRHVHVGVSDSVDPAPVVTCGPASGSTFPLGTTSVTCNASDAAGNTSAGFVQRRRPRHDRPGPERRAWRQVGDDGESIGRRGLVARPERQRLGRRQSRRDVLAGLRVDVPGRDDNGPLLRQRPSGNTASATFRVTVTLNEPPPQTDVYTVQWSEPVTDGTLSANQGRSVPLKLRLFVNGVERTSGNAALSIVPCGGGSAVVCRSTSAAAAGR